MNKKAKCKKCTLGNTVKMSFKNAPFGARFKKLNIDDGYTWVKLSMSRNPKTNEEEGLICRWVGNKQCVQLFGIFADKESGVTFETEIELI